MDTEAPRQLVEHLIWEARTHWLYSGPGAGKTLFALAILLHMAAGKPFHGLNVVQGGALVIMEDSSDSVIAEYLLMLADIYELDLSTLPVLFHRERGLRIMDRAGADYVRAMIAQAPFKPAVLLIDACERVVPSDNFSTKELDGIAQLFARNLADGIANMMIDHTRKPQANGGEKVDPMELLYGGRTKSAIADVMLFLSGRIKDKALLSFTKFRGEAPPPIGVSFDGAAGFAIKLQGVQLTETERQVMEIMNNSLGTPRTRAEIEEAAQLKTSTAMRVLTRLLAIGWIERLGEHKNTTYHATRSSGGGLFT